MASGDETRVFTPNNQPSPEQLVGTVLAGRYQIQELLGVGAMGAVYLGQHLKIGRKDAIKVLNAAMARDPEAIARFDRGARNVGAIRHPNVCTIYDFSDTDNGLQYLAMEFVPGESLKDLCDRTGPLDLQRSVRIAEQVASALQAAHNAGVVHRDLKPANIMIAQGPDGEDIVKVVDFDISKGSQDEVKVEVTRLGFVVGTPEYMSPEQLCDGALDGRSDVYSLALVLCRMLTGKLPFRGESLQDIMSARLTDTPLIPLNELAPGREFPPMLQRVLEHALKRRAEDRTASAAAFGNELRAALAPAETRVLAGELPATRVSEARSVGVARQRGRAIVIAGGVVTVAVLGFGVMKFMAPEQQTNTNADSAAIGAPLLPTDTAQAKQPAGTNPQVQTQRPPATAKNDPITAPGPVPKPVNALAERAGAVLSAQRERLLQSPFPEASLLRAMRDTAMQLFDADGITGKDRALAAYLAASESLSLGEAGACSTWATRARDLAPTNNSYGRMLTNCQSIGQ